MYALLWPTNRFVGSEIPKNNTFDLIDNTCESLNYIANIFQETLNSLVLMDPEDRPAFYIRITKISIGPKVDLFWDHSLRILAAGKAFLVWNL